MSIDPAEKAIGTSVAFGRPNDAIAYGANDVIGPGTGPFGAVLAFTFRPGEFMITSASLKIDSSALIAGEAGYNLYLYDSSPASALADNAAFDLTSADAINLIGKISLGTPVDEGSTLYIRTDGINQEVSIAPNVGNIYAYLVTVGAYTPVANRAYRIRLHGIPL